MIWLAFAISVGLCFAIMTHRDRIIRGLTIATYHFKYFLEDHMHKKKCIALEEKPRLPMKSEAQLRTEAMLKHTQDIIYDIARQKRFDKEQALVMAAEVEKHKQQTQEELQHKYILEQEEKKKKEEIEKNLLPNPNIKLGDDVRHNELAYRYGMQKNGWYKVTSFEGSYVIIMDDRLNHMKCHTGFLKHVKINNGMEVENA